MPENSGVLYRMLHWRTIRVRQFSHATHPKGRWNRTNCRRRWSPGRSRRSFDPVLGPSLLKVSETDGFNLKSPGHALREAQRRHQEVRDPRLRHVPVDRGHHHRSRTSPRETIWVRGARPGPRSSTRLRTAPRWHAGCACRRDPCTPAAVAPLGTMKWAKDPTSQYVGSITTPGEKIARLKASPCRAGQP